MTSEVTWLLEYNGEKKNFVAYWSECGCLTTDAYKAMRFDSKEEAQKYKDENLNEILNLIKPVEHMFVS